MDDLLTFSVHRHRCLPNILRKPPIEQHVHQHGGVDHIVRDVRHVLRSSCNPHDSTSDTRLQRTQSILTSNQGPIFGTLFDSYGPRYILLAGTFLHVFGLMMASLSTEYYQLILAQGICSPLGASAIFNACVNSVSTWFAKRRASALGIMASGSSLGGVIFPIMVSHLIPLVGFAWVMRICAFVILFMLVISNLTLKSRLTHTKKSVSILNFVRQLKDAKFVVTVAGCFCFFWGMFLPFTFVITQAERYGMSPDLSQYLIPILNAAR